MTKAVSSNTLWKSWASVMELGICHTYKFPNQNLRWSWTCQ